MRARLPRNRGSLRGPIHLRSVEKQGDEHLRVLAGRHVNKTLLFGLLSSMGYQTNLRWVKMLGFRREKTRRFLKARNDRTTRRSHRVIEKRSDTKVFRVRYMPPRDGMLLLEHTTV